MIHVSFCLIVHKILYQKTQNKTKQGDDDEEEDGNDNNDDENDKDFNTTLWRNQSKEDGSMIAQSDVVKNK